MKILETIGIDVSKKVIDVHLHKTGSHHQFENKEEGFKQMSLWLKNCSKFSMENSLFALTYRALFLLPVELSGRERF